MKNRISTNIRNIIWVMLFATLLYKVSAMGGNPPALSKLTLGMALWVIIIQFPYRYFKKNDYGKPVNFLLRMVILLTFLAVIRSIFGPVEGHVGNKWVSLFGNEECMFMMLTPCFLVLGMELGAVSELKEAIQVSLILSVLTLFTGYYVGAFLWISACFYPYMKRPIRALFYVAVAMSVISAFFAEETSRSTIVVLGMILLTYTSVNFLKSRKVIGIICMSLIALPLIYGVMTLVDPNFSVFQIILNQLMDSTGDEQLTTDTRSFLFWEMSENLNKNHAWFFGKGALSHYYSDFFAQSTSAESSSRITVEVTFLQLLLRGGVTYAVVYYGIFVLAIRNAIKRAQNKFVLSIAIMASGWVLFSCVSYLNGCNFLHLGFFILLSCCLSDRWLNYTDDEVKMILKR